MAKLGNIRFPDAKFEGEMRVVKNAILQFIDNQWIVIKNG